MAAYSLDLRQKILYAYERRLGSQCALAHMFRVSLAFVEKVLRQHRTTGTIAPKPHVGGQRPRLAEATHVLCPNLVLGDIVVMDNLRAHKVAGIRERIEAQGAQLISLPPYSPDRSPIEPCWSKLKTFLRAAEARTREALDAAIEQVLAAVTPSDARGWFRHCGSTLR